MPNKKKVEILPSEFAQKFLYLNGKPLSLADYKHLIDIYNFTNREIVLKFSRQTAKSTTLANIMITRAAMIPHFKVLYVSPTVDQTKIFSHERVAPVIEGSPLIKENYINSTLIQNVYMKQFLNGSRMYLRYALLTADRLRGYSADMNLFDETQDLRPDIIPVVKETMSRSLFKYALYAGTPKRTKGTLADLWFSSTMNEYAIKCSSCNYWNILDEKNIGLEGTICSKCGSYLDLINGKSEWVSTYSLTQKPYIEGYRVCILHFAHAPWVNWKTDVLLKRETSSKAVFYNEALALEYDEGISPVNKFQIQACCSDKPMVSEPTELDRNYSSIMGIDYGPSGSE
ncbi:MAG: phage terminase large subunit family protein, partial [bacterium]|nr:phage terminase large subunit family protein [bacterium]